MRLGGAVWECDLGRPICLAVPTSFEGEGLRCFGAPAASAHPLSVPGFTGRVELGGSCNCSTLTLTPHCNGTHTECAGHLTVQRLDAFRVVPAGPIPALLVTTPGRSAVTAQDLERAWSAAARAGLPPRALVVRTSRADGAPSDPQTRLRELGSGSAGYLEPEAAGWLVERGIEHLVVDLPSIDPMKDGGRLAAHRAFFGLPPGSSDLALAARAGCTITELACVPDAAADGEYLLELQTPALAGDAVPSRPLLFAVERG